MPPPPPLQSLHNHMVKLRLQVPVATFLTEVVVDRRDPAFSSPSKPVGPFYPEARARELAIEQGLVVREDAGRGWRRVGPSPASVEIVPRPAIAIYECIVSIYVFIVYESLRRG
jgi:carbamate kinase